MFSTKLNGARAKKFLVLTASEVASGSVDKLGYEYSTYGHWVHGV